MSERSTSELRPAPNAVSLPYRFVIKIYYVSDPFLVSRFVCQLCNQALALIFLSIELFLATPRLV